MPVIETGVGNVHVYVDAAADLDKALAIVLNAKTSRTSVCNSAESLLVHAAVADEFLPRVVKALQAESVTVHGDDAFGAYDGVLEATDEDWATEYLSLNIAAAVVPDLEAAIAHIRRVVEWPHRGDRDREPRRGAPVHRRRRCGSGDGERIDAVHRRR